MSKFKAGDRIQAIVKPEVIGTVTRIENRLAYVVLDNAFGKDESGRPIKEGFLPIDLEAAFKVIEKTDWESLWDSAADSTSDE